ncbi:MAG: integration host factor subunit beta [Deltaproteobacteria bacterium]|nr:integration host factor subunit beta [Deltaproteobacteria bacterium]MCX7952039.1 integration host factor subunit beta [Deltaproteobacteria bacterium]
MNKTQFIESLAEVLKEKKFNDFTIDKTKDLVEAFFSTITEFLLEGKRIELRGFGTFELRKYKGYQGVNPKTGKKVISKPKKIPFFKVSKDLVVVEDKSNKSI